MKHLAIVLNLVFLLITTNFVFADERRYEPPPTTETTTLALPSQSTYGLLALAANNQFDWGVPDKLQVGVTMAFTEGGNQAIAFGMGSRFGGVLVHGQFTTTINAPEHEDDYALIVGGLMHF